MNITIDLNSWHGRWAQQQVLDRYRKRYGFDPDDEKAIIGNMNFCEYSWTVTKYVLSNMGSWLGIAFICILLAIFSAILFYGGAVLVTAAIFGFVMGHAPHLNVAEGLSSTLFLVGVLTVAFIELVEKAKHRTRQHYSVVKVVVAKWKCMVHNRCPIETTVIDSRE